MRDPAIEMVPAIGSDGELTYCAVPPIPVALAGEEPAPTERRKESQAQRPGAALLAPASPRAADSAEDALISKNEVEVTRSRVEKLNLRRQEVDHVDALRARNQRIADEKAARQQQEHEEQEERQRQIQQQQAAERRGEWRDEWIRYAQRSRPDDTPETIELDIVEQVERVLETLDPSRDYYLVQRQVNRGRPASAGAMEGGASKTRSHRRGASI